MKLSDQLARLAEGDTDQWRIEQEPHSYRDGTTHFTHVLYDAKDRTGETMTVRVGQYVTPDTAELMCLLHNNAKQIIAALRAFGN